MRTALPTLIGVASGGTDTNVGRNRHGCRSFAAVMRRARVLKPNKVAVELAHITGKSVRTAERWLSGEVTPDGESTLRLFLSEMGPAFLAAKVAEMPPERQEAFWREMGKAQKRADLRLRRAALEREIIESGLDP